MTGLLLVASYSYAKNICSITLGSSDELVFFKSMLNRNGQSFQSFEISKESENFESSFEGFCKQKTPCDVVIISSHYDGIDFYGEDPRTKAKKKNFVSKGKLIEYAARNFCPEFFKTPKEVYLFGCNTLAKNNIYQRSPEQYAADLRKSGMNEYDIQRIIGERFTSMFNFGVLTYDLMRGLFPNSVLSGYVDIGVAGPRAISYIKSFKGSEKDLPEYLAAKVPGMVTAQGYNIFPDPTTETKIARIFSLRSPSIGEDISFQLKLLNEIFNEDAVGSYLPEIEEFLFRHREYLEMYSTIDPQGQGKLLNYWKSVQQKATSKDLQYLIGVRLSSIFILLEWPTHEFDYFRNET